jgi:ribosomal protein L1
MSSTEIMQRMQEADEQLKNLNRKNLSDLVMLSKPPQALKYVLESFLILMDVKDLSYKEAKTMIRGADFVQKLL